MGELINRPCVHYFFILFVNLEKIKEKVKITAEIGQNPFFSLFFTGRAEL